MPERTPTPPPNLKSRNRDHERLYRPGLLSKWFLLASVLLVAALGIMIWKDYARPWKTYQKTFFGKQIEVARDKAKERRQFLLAQGAEIRAAEAAVDAAWRQIQAARTPSHAELLELQHAAARDLESADSLVKSVKGLLAPARYIFETRRARAEAMERAKSLSTPFEDRPVGDGRLADAKEATEAARVDVLREGQRLFEAESAFREVAARHQDVTRRIAAMEKPWLEAKATLAALSSKRAEAEAQLAGLESLYEKNQWRNAPFLDFISPSIRVQQQVLENIHDNWNFATNKRVDRCTTCHLGTDLPEFGDEALIERYALEPWMQAHPGLDLIAGKTSPHKIELFGCTVCHNGVGWATDFSRAAHLPQNEEQKARWKEDHKWHKVKYIDFPMLPVALTEGQCTKCHKDGIAWPVQYLERLDHGFLAGEHSSEKLANNQRAPLGQLRWNEPDDPKFNSPENRLLGPWEVYGDYVLPKAPAPVDGSMLAVAEARRESLLAQYGDAMGDAWADELERWVDDTVHDYGWRADTYERGFDTIVQYGCQACHKVADFATYLGEEQPERLAPSLTAIADKLDARFVGKWIANPESFRIDTKMPSYFWFTAKDAEWNPSRNEDGSLRTLPVMDAHLLDPVLGRELGSQVRPEDLDEMRLHVVAMTTFLLNQRRQPGRAPVTHRDAADPAAYNPGYDEELPPGDVERGRALVSSKGCVACHIVGEVQDKVGELVEWVEDGPWRFDNDPLRMPGPRLVGLGSKFSDGRWLNAWLRDPKHYTPTTRMPNMRLEDKVDFQGRVVESGAQVRADIIAYLLSSRQADFDAQPDIGWSPSYTADLRQLYETFFGKTSEGEWLTRGVLEGRTASLEGARLSGILSQVGERLMARNGCFGCHAVAGHEEDQPIGAELTSHGQKDLHQLDFGVVPKAVIPHTRWDFFLHKVRTPRIWDYGKLKVGDDRLRMPRFNMREAPHSPDTRVAVAAMVTGFTKEPIHGAALAKNTPAEQDLVDGRRVASRYGCNNCHTIEGKAGLYWQHQSELVSDKAALPPNLFGQGHRTHADWLVGFLKNPVWLRPIVQAHMPKFGMSDAEATALARYFIRLTGSERGLVDVLASPRLAAGRYPTPISLPGRPGQGNVSVSNWVEEARLLFDVMACNACHLPKGWPGQKPEDGGVAPSFSHARERLRQSWVEAMLHNPLNLIEGTKMAQFWPTPRGYGRRVLPNGLPFQFWLRDDAEWQALMASTNEEDQNEAMTRLAQAQMAAMAEFVVRHYEPPAEPAAPAPPEAPH